MLLPLPEFDSEEIVKNINTLIIGIGNRLRQDDAAGPFLIDILKEKELPPHVMLLEDKGEPANLMNGWKACDTVILIDSVISGAPVGTIHDVDLSNDPLPNTFGQTSSHAIGLAEAVELGRAMENLPARVLFYGIEGRRFEIGQSMSPEVEQALDPLAEKILQPLK